LDDQFHEQLIAPLAGMRLEICTFEPADGAESGLLVAADGRSVVGSRVDGDAVVTAFLDQLG